LCGVYLIGEKMEVFESGIGDVLIRALMKTGSG
jgi:hypothetical protein